jgi:hypothetical protein
MTNNLEASSGKQESPIERVSFQDLALLDYILYDSSQRMPEVQLKPDDPLYKTWLEYRALVEKQESNGEDTLPERSRLFNYAAMSMAERGIKNPQEFVRRFTEIQSLFFRKITLGYQVYFECIFSRRE